MQEKRSKRILASSSGISYNHENHNRCIKQSHRSSSRTTTQQQLGPTRVLLKKTFPGRNSLQYVRQRTNRIIQSCQILQIMDRRLQTNPEDRPQTANFGIQTTLRESIATPTTPTRFHRTIQHRHRIRTWRRKQRS